jgi:hypothetical protein
MDVRIGGGPPCGALKSVGNRANVQNPMLPTNKRNEAATESQDRLIPSRRAIPSANVVKAKRQNATVPRIADRPTAYSLRKRLAGL